MTSRQLPAPAARAVRPTSGRLLPIVARVALVILAMRIQLPLGLSAGLPVAVALIPLWAPVIRRYSGMRLLIVAVVVAIASGLWLTEYHSATHGDSTALLVGSISNVVSIALGVGVVIWARELLGDGRVVTWYALGLLLSIDVGSSAFASNPWRFGFSVGVTLLLLAVAERSGRRSIELVVATALLVVALGADSRSWFAILLLTVLAVAWQMRPVSPTRRGSALRVVIGLAGLAAVVYNFGQAIVLDGLLGEAARERSVQQLELTGSLLLGGRPEIAATTALMAHHPIGYGAGTLPNPDDILVAKTGLASIGYDPDNGYVDNYMFGGRIELHSLVGDFWASYGIAGILLAAVLVFLTVRGLSVRIAHLTASAPAIYLGGKLLWDTMFGPIYTALPLLVLAIGLLLLRKPGPSGPSADPAPAGLVSVESAGLRPPSRSAKRLA